MRAQVRRRRSHLFTANCKLPRVQFPAVLLAPRTIVNQLAWP